MIRYLKSALLLLLPACGVIDAAAQPGTMTKPGEILSGLQKLRTTGSVLYIAAHPDDENTRLLAWLANERHLRTGYLSLTRGDGGQNLIGKEQGEMLGLIRTQELLAARRTDGAEQFFTRANDFGFSKNPEETFSIWNRDSILADVVWTIRKFRPDIIICRFPTTGEGGHGHHTASAILAGEAFEAAGDPKRFPWQLRHVSVWQPKRLFWNTFNFGTTNTIRPDQLKADVGGFNPLLGESYGEIAAESRSNHKSQGFGTARSRGESFEYFKQLRGDSVKTDLFEGINQGWSRVPGSGKLQQLTDAAFSKFSPQNPAADLPQLAAVYKALQALPESNPETAYWKKLKLQECENLLLACAGIWLEATATNPAAIPGRPITVNIQALSSEAAGNTLKSLSWIAGDSSLRLQMTKNTLYSFTHRETLDPQTALSTPYWLISPHPVANYVIGDPLMIGKPENDYGPTIRFAMNVAGIDLNVSRRIVYRWVDPVKGELYRPLEVLPPLTIGLSDKVLVFNDTAAKTLAVTVRASADGIAGSLLAKAPQGWEVRIAEPAFTLAKEGDEKSILVSIRRGAGSANGQLQLSAGVGGNSYNKSIRRVEYDHIPYQFTLDDANARLVGIDLKKRGSQVGYIPGAGDDIPASLMQVGYTVTTLTDEILAKGNLSGFDAIVTGVRAYNVNERLPKYHDRLMDYVKAGGNLIVQYNTNTRLGPMTTQPGPYPFTLTNQRVTDENAAVSFTLPDHPVLNTPNKISAADFDGWVQERGIYFATEYDPHYEAPLRMADKGEKPADGSLIIGKWGKGNFVYTGLVFFRELPAGVPGAYRLFANLLSLPKN